MTTKTKSQILNLKELTRVFLNVFLLLIIVSCKSNVQDYKVTPVPFNQVHLNDDFWSKRIETNRDVTIPIAFKHCETTGRIDNFKIAGGLMEGEFKSEAPFDDSDVSKIIEGAA
ncbi:MAG: glycoside hydrolase family 127 protein, partial [Fermentimonas sp.]|nr:glycoside hydrolase family 127 protein [Fermentimonas sp.]